MLQFNEYFDNKVTLNQPFRSVNNEKMAANKVLAGRRFLAAYVAVHSAYIENFHKLILTENLYIQNPS